MAAVSRPVLSRPVLSKPVSRLTVPVFTVAVCCGAMLVFLVQPMVAKLVLPRLGGAPSVWNTSLLFFQVSLLLGYGYSHLLSTYLPASRQLASHLVLLALPLLVLPIAIPDWSAPNTGTPVWWLLGVLAVTAGLPFLAVSTASPLLQRWFSRSGHSRAADPYFLYAASNVGSLVGLAAYPLVLEPNFSLADQAKVWAIGYVGFALLVIGAGLLLRGSLSATIADSGAAAMADVLPFEGADPAPADDGVDGPEIAERWAHRLRWVGLAAIPSSLMAGATTYLSTDVASFPLLWILPLAAYLVSFILAFMSRNPFTPARLAPVSVFVALLVLLGTNSGSTLTIPFVGLHVGLVLVAGLVCHGQLAATRPRAARLTEFFLLTSLGGALGGAFNAIVAPLVFNGVTEYPIAIVALLLGRFAIRTVPRDPAADGAILRRRSRVGWVLPVIAAVAAAALIRWGHEHTTRTTLLALGAGLLVFRWRTSSLVAVLMAAVLATTTEAEGFALRTRSFYGTLKVEVTDTFTQLSNGSTLHGTQIRDPKKASRPTSYYHPTGPLGRVFASLDGDERRTRVGVVGLGAGTIAAYSRAGDHFTFYDIDPEVVKIATDPTWFTYVSGAKGKVDIVVGDARLRLESTPEDSFGVLVIDAFSSDSIPLHLITAEAYRLYRSRLTDNGILMVHTSNRYFDLEPVVGALAKDLGLASLVFDDGEISESDEAEGKDASQWIALARHEEDLAKLAADDAWKPVRIGSKVWTDDFSSVLTALNL